MAVAEILIQAGSLTGKRFAIPANAKLTVGRHPECGVRLLDEGVSRSHCRLEADNVGVRVVDTLSANGTWVNDQRIEHAKLAHNDTITVGVCVLRFLEPRQHEAQGPFADESTAPRDFTGPLRSPTASSLDLEDETLSGSHDEALDGSLDEVQTSEASVITSAKPPPLPTDSAIDHALGEALDDHDTSEMADPLAFIDSATVHDYETRIVDSAEILGRARQAAIDAASAVIVEGDTGLETALSATFDVGTNLFTDSMFGREAQALQMLEVISNLGQTIYSSRSMMVIADAIMEAIVTVSACDRAALLLLDESGKLAPVAMRAMRDDGRSEFRVSQTIVDETLRRGVSLVSSDASQDARFNMGDSVLIQSVRSVLCVPLQAHKKSIGVIYLDSTNVDVVFGESEMAMAAAIGQQAGVAIERARLVSDLERLFLGSMFAIVASIEAKDAYTRGHSERVALSAMLIGAQLDLPPEEMDVLELGGLLHDVGKIGMRESVLQKPGALDEEEFAEVRKHPEIGAKIIGNMPEISRIVDMEAILAAVRHHHERVDGGGYPDGLAKDDVPFCARVLAVADTFDALTSDRPYRKGCGVDLALKIIEEGAGTQFDPTIVEAFLRAVRGGADISRLRRRFVRSAARSRRPWE